MNTIWIGIATLMNACSASYLYILFEKNHADNQEKLTDIKVASLTWYAISFLVLQPYLLEIFLRSKTTMVLTATIISIMILTGLYNLKKLWTYSIAKSSMLYYVAGLITFSAIHNALYTPERALYFLLLSSVVLMYFCVKTVWFYNINKLKKRSSLGSGYVFGAMVIQISGLYLAFTNPSDIVQAMLLASVPLMLYGFGFIAFENIDFVIQQNMKEIKNKSEELNAAYEALHHSSHYDDQTGLRNRKYFDTDLENVLHSHTVAWVGLVNFKNFKKVNEALSFHEGDQIIKALSEQVYAFTPISCALYRLSGDRFAFIYKNATEDAVLNLSNKIQRQFEAYSKTNELPVTLEAGIGITEVNDAKSLEGIHRELELSMATASTSSEQTHTIYNENLLHEFIKQNQFKEDLKSAAKNEDWSIYFHPQIDVNTGNISGAEILIRWETEDGKILSPGSFIPMAESIGLMKNIGLSVIDKSFRSIHELNLKGHEEILYAINLSGDQFMSDEILTALESLKHVYDIPDGQIILEICETVFIENFESANSHIEKYHQLGFKVALDDFGTGYSSLQYLSELQVDEVKFDKQFVLNIDNNVKAKSILGTMITLAKQLELRHVIEGVESSSQLRTIESLGGEIYQGYYFSMPMDAFSLEQILDIFKSTTISA